MTGKAFVDGELVAEADLLSMINGQVTRFPGRGRYVPDSSHRCC